MVGDFQFPCLWASWFSAYKNPYIYKKELFIFVSEDSLSVDSFTPCAMGFVVDTVCCTV